jgi:hypothetical protein
MTALKEANPHRSDTLEGNPGGLSDTSVLRKLTLRLGRGLKRFPTRDQRQLLAEQLFQLKQKLDGGTLTTQAEGSIRKRKVEQLDMKVDERPATSYNDDDLPNQFQKKPR